MIKHVNQTRQRILEVPEAAIWAMFSATPQRPTTSETLPEGASLDCIMHDAARKVFLLVISHESFPLVNHGSPVPVMEVGWEEDE